jgi:hypothetical protein
MMMVAGVLFAAVCLSSFRPRGADRKVTITAGRAGVFEIMSNPPGFGERARTKDCPQIARDCQGYQRLSTDGRGPVCHLAVFRLSLVNPQPVIRAGASLVACGSKRGVLTP